MSGHIHLIPADFEEYNLDDLDNENANNKGRGVCWLNGGKGGHGAQEFKVGDTVYIYFHDSKRLTDRILLKAVVSDTDYDDEKRFYFSEYAEEQLNAEGNKEKLSYEQRQAYKKIMDEKYKGFYLNNFKPINDEDRENDRFRYIHADENKDSVGIQGVKITQTKLYLDKDYLEEELKKCEKKNDLVGIDSIKKRIALGEMLEKTKFANKQLKTLKEYYNRNVCAICTGKEIEANSFKKPNGIYYFELHHVLQQNFNTIINKLSADELKEKYPWFNKEKYGEGYKNILIYGNNYNEVKLCSKHHNELHYGEYECRRRILKKLVDENYKNALYDLVKKESDVEEILKYIYVQYGLEYKE